jgi:hypothetical protein
VLVGSQGHSKSPLVCTAESECARNPTMRCTAAGRNVGCVCTDGNRVDRSHVVAVVVAVVIEHAVSCLRAAAVH